MKHKTYYFAVVLTCGTLLHSAFVQAATYVVDNTNPRAADTNSGTREAPFKTVSAAAQKAQAGDEVLVRPGIYREAVTLNNSGKLGQPIIFRSEVPRAAVISGSDVITDWRAEGPGLWSMDAPNLRKYAYGDFGNSEWIFVDGYPLQRADARNQLAPGGFWHDFDNKRVWVMPEEGQDIESLKVEYAHRSGLMRAARQLDDIHIIGFTLTHNADVFRAPRAISGNGMRWLVENNHLLWNLYSAISLGGNACIVRNNLVEWSGDAAIGGSGINLLIENNKFFHNNWRRINPNFEGGVSKWVYTLDSRIRNNETAYNFGYGLWTDIHNFGNVFEGNVCHDDLMGASLFTEISSGDIIRDNVVFNSNTGITIGESPNTLVRNNIIFNNDTGIRMRGNYRRNNANNWDAAHNGIGADTYEKYLANTAKIPGITDIEVEQHMARYLLFWRAPSFHMSNNSYIEGNLVFDNNTNYFEHRNYAETSKTDPFINNFSNYNIFYHAKPENNFRHAGGTYTDFAAWQKASGRDVHSIHADPRDPKTKLPEWAEAKRALWSRKYRSHQEMRDLRLGLIDSPMAAQLMARIRRASNVRPISMNDAQIKAVQFDMDGQNVVAVWTSQTSDRRYVRLHAGAKNVVVENGYGGQKPRALPNGTVEVVATFVPTYVRGVGQTVSEVPGSTLTARSFNAPGQPVPVTAVFVNNSAQPQDLAATFSARQGFRVVTPQMRRRLKAGERVEVALSLVPENNFVGTGRVSFDARLGTERIIRSATFAVGEGGARLMTATTAPVVDGKLEDWDKFGNAAVLGAIADPAQIVNGERALWGGTNDSSAKIYSVWTRDALYAAIAVTDDRVLPSGPAEQPYHNDAVEFFVDGRASDMQWQQQPTEGVYQIAIGPGTEAGKPSLQVLSPSPLNGLTTALTRTDKGYIVELRIPLTTQNFPARDWTAGRSAKMSVLLNDRDDPKAPRDNLLGWNFSPEGRNHRDTSGWKTLVLE